jgi:hypothetical protein
LAVGAEELEPGTAELGVLVPRGAVSNDLHSFGRELQRLDRTFGVFAELATTTQEGFQIRTISSSDLSVYLEALPQVAACAAVAVERVVALYKKILEIRRLKSELAEQGVPEESLEGVLTHADDHMKEGLKPVVEELLDEYYEGKDKKRLNELRTYLQSSLNEIANRIDKGYHIEVRVEPPEQADAEADDGDEQAFKYIQAIQDAQPGLQFFRTEGDPILRLLEGTDADAPSEDDKKDGKDKKSD